MEPSDQFGEMVNLRGETGDNTNTAGTDVLIAGMPPGRDHPACSVRGLRKRYESEGGALDVLRGLNLEVYPGEMVAIVGASGVGKSTLLHLMGGLDRPTDGEVLWGPTNPFKIGDQRRSMLRNRQVGFVFQFHHLLPEFTALENVAVPLWIAGLDRHEAGKRAQEALERVGVGDRSTHRPGELSGGEQQRTAVARAFVGGAPLILADEPSGNLDRDTAGHLHDTLRELTHIDSRSLVIATHDLALAGKADRVFRLSDGLLQQEAPNG